MIVKLWKAVPNVSPASICPWEVKAFLIRNVAVLARLNWGNTALSSHLVTALFHLQ